MITIVFANRKGGVGKTTSTLNVGYALLELGKSVLLIDTDPQANLTNSFPYVAEAGRRLEDVLLGTAMLAQVAQEVGESLYLIPAGPGLVDAQEKRSRLPGADLMLRRVLSGVEGFDYCLIDTSPYLGPLTDAALTAADAVFIPTEPEAYGVDGLIELIVRCNQVQEALNPNLKIGGVFFTCYNRKDPRRVQRDTITMLENLEVLKPLLMKQTIRRSVALVEEATGRHNIFQLAPTSTGALDYAALTTEILQRLDHE